MIWFYTAILGVSALFLSGAGTLGIRELMKSMAVLREPNARDNHDVATPSGGGLAVMIAVIGFFVVSDVDAYIILALLLLVAVSFADDVMNLSALLRMVVHVVAAFFMVITIQQPVLHGLVPPQYEFPVLVAVIVWFMNIYNFMDGIDEITSIQTVSIMGAIISLGVVFPSLPNSLSIDSIIVLCSVLGFWYFNRHPATIFMGDSGSITLGATIAWLLMLLSAEGYWMIALMLPAYYVVDSSITLLKRLLTGQKVWQAHSQHAYQAVVRGGRSHCRAAYSVALYNMVVIGLVYLSIYMPPYAVYALIAAYGLAVLLCLVFWATPKAIETQDTDEPLPLIDAVS